MRRPVNLQSILDTLTRPSADLHGFNERQHARLLAKVLITIIGLATAANILLFNIEPEVWGTTVNVTWYAIGILSFVYVLSRTRYYVIGTVIAALMPLIAEILYINTIPEDANIAFSVIIGILLASAILSPRSTILFVICNVAILLLIPFIIPVEWDGWSFNIIQVLIASALIAVARAHHYNIQINQEAQLSETQLELGSTYDNLRLVLQNLPIAVTAISEDDTVIMWNAAATRMTGLRAHQVEAEDLATLFNLPTDDNQKIADFWGDEVGIQHQANFTRYIGIYNMAERFPVPDWKFWMVAIDLTDVKQREQMIQEYHRLTLSFQEQSARNDLIQQVISALSHDMKIPLSVINTSSDNFERYYDHFTDEQRKQKIESIQRQVSLATALLDDTVTAIRSADFARPTQLTTLNLATLFDISVKQFEHTTDKHTFEFIQHDEIGLVQSDEVLINRILINLLNNAIKYSPDGGVIRLELSQDSDWIICDVIDEGIGIPEEDLPHIFDLFYRAKTVEDMNGTGIGLTTVKNSVDALNGTISVTSELGVETHFTVKIPYIPAITPTSDAMML